MKVYEIIRTRVLTIKEEIVLTAENEREARGLANSYINNDSFPVKETAERQVSFVITELAGEEESGVRKGTD